MLITMGMLLVLVEYSSDITELQNQPAAAKSCNNIHLLTLNVSRNITATIHLLNLGGKLTRSSCNYNNKTIWVILTVILQSWQNKAWYIELMK